MKNPQLLSQIQNLSHSEKLEIMLFLASELAKEEGIINSDDPNLYLAQLRNSAEAAHQLQALLEQEKQIQNV
jgi:hypothetical protein